MIAYCLRLQSGEVVMRWDSVRALKEEIATNVAPPAVEAIRRAGGFSIVTFSLDRVTPAEPMVALGIAPGSKRDDATLAVRLQRRSLEHAEDFLEDIRKRSHNEVDIRFVGQISTREGPWYRSKLRPLRPGGSVRHFSITAGTIGAFATDRKSGNTVILSNNHVLANENRGKARDHVLQPGHTDAGRQPGDTVAFLERWVELRRDQKNIVDAATARLKRGLSCDPDDYGELGRLAGTRSEPITGPITVAKIGRTTGLTRGRVTAVEVDNVVVSFDFGSLGFEKQIEIESAEDGAFSSGGDSGSLILDSEMRACGLLFAGSEAGGRNGRGLTYANPIADVLDRLEIALPVP
jgi:hypothetical protein